MGELPGAPPAFVEREAVGRLAEVFADGGGVAAVSALTGGRGAGKTQVAAQYARDAIAQGIELVAWVSADDQSRLQAGLAEIARRLDVADPEGDSETSAQRLRDALVVRGTPSVLVFDNANDPNTVRKYLPATGNTQVIITSTDHSFSSLGADITVDRFDRSQSLTYLRERTGLNDEDGANKLADELGDLPLGLAQAATVIKLQGQTYDTYLTRLKTLPMDVTLPAARGDSYPHGVARTITLSVKAVEDADESGLTHRALTTTALLNASGVSRHLLAKLASAPAEQLDETLGSLTESSLMVWGEDRESIVMHRLVARTIRDQLQATGDLQDCIITAVKGLHPLLPDEDRAWEHREDGIELLAQASALWENAVDAAGRGVMTPAGLATTATLALWAVQHLIATADLSRATETGMAVLSACEQTLGPEHPSTLASRNNLANAYQAAGQLDKAIALHKSNLAARERVLAPDHPDTLTSRNNLAAAYEAAGQLDKAIALHKENLTASEHTLGPNHLRTLTFRNNLASAYKTAGRLDEAIRLYTENLTACEHTLGPNHLRTLTSRNNLANAYQAAGDLGKAILLHKENLTACEHMLGSGHPETLTSRNNLANAYQAAGDLGKAIALHEENLTIREHTLSPNHPDTLTSRNNLANAYLAAGQPDKAIALHEENLTIREHTLSPNHPDTLTSRNNLANAYKAVGRLDEAIALYKDNLTTCERVLGPDHPDTLSSRNNLAAAYEAAGRLDEAIALYKDNLTTCERVLGPDHPHTLTSCNNLANAYQAAGQNDKAIPLHEDNVAACERIFGHNHPNTIKSRNNLDTARRAFEDSG